MRIKIIPFLIMTIAISIPAFAGSKTYATIFLDLKAFNCAPRDAASVNRIIRGKIDRIKYCDLVSEKSTAAIINKNGMNAACYDRVCAVQIAKKAGSERVIYGTVNRAMVKYTQRLGKEGAWKYLLEEKALESYVVTLYLVAVDRGAVLGVISETAAINMVNSAAERIAARLQAYYKPLDEAKKDKSAKSAEHEKPVFYLHVGPSGFVPVGVFRSMARGGAGFIVGAGVENLVISNTRLALQMGYYYVFPSGKKIESHHAVPLSVLLGYSFKLPMGFSLAPLLGGGYIFNVLSQDTGTFRIPGVYRYSTKRYYDPHLLVKLEAAYHFNEHYAIVLSPGYFVFFEKSSTGMFVSFDAGFKYTF